MFSSPISSYQKISLESEIQGADPVHLITLLFDGAQAALEKAQAQLAAKDFRGKSDSLTKAILIIVEGLSASLNVEQGGEVAERLQALYSYMVSRLTHANVQQDSSAITEVQQLLAELGGAWRELRPNLAGEQHSAKQNP
ncbi:MAG: flagellar export chaperone FliS [Betaproteobacteria bacterium]|nr:flagellar export chaperone FliS [Betaproteobacteria bacterium]